MLKCDEITKKHFSTFILKHNFLKKITIFFDTGIRIGGDDIVVEHNLVAQAMLRGAYWDRFEKRNNLVKKLYKICLMTLNQTQSLSCFIEFLLHKLYTGLARELQASGR